MTIELTSKPQPTLAKETSPQVSKKVAAENAAGAPAGLSFFAILEGVDTAPASNLTPEAEAEVGLPLVGAVGPMQSDTPPTSGEDAPQELLADAALLALLGVTPPPVPGALPADVMAAKPARPQGAEGGAEGGAPMVGAPETGLKRASVGVTKSGREALLASLEAANASALGNAADPTAATSPTALMPPKEGLSERIQRLSSEVSASLFKGVEVAPLAGIVIRERLQEPGAPLRSMGSDGVVQVGGLQQSAGGAMGVDGVIAGAAAEAMGDHFSEEVKYWVGQDVQKAELTLDGMGLSAVEVSISLQGNEAHVAFRTDEAQTRDALSNASTQLQDALSRQGMSLAGVSVGTSNSSGDSRERSGQGQGSPWRRARVESGTEEAVSSGIKPLNSGRNIDLFV